MTPPPYQTLAEKPYWLHISAIEVLANELEKGQVDVIAGLNPSEERNEFAFYAPFKAADELRVISRDGIKIENYDDFHSKIIGVSRGAAYVPRFDQDNKLKKTAMQSERIGFSLLVKNRVDLIMVSPATLATLSTELSDTKLKVSPIELEEMRNKETAFGFSKKHKLGLSNKEIIVKVSEAYKQGRFN